MIASELKILPWKDATYQNNYLPTIKKFLILVK